MAHLFETLSRLARRRAATDCHDGSTQESAFDFVVAAAQRVVFASLMLGASSW
jgi:hypothetical protein